MAAIAHKNFSSLMGFSALFYSLIRYNLNLVAFPFASHLEGFHLLPIWKVHVVIELSLLLCSLLLMNQIRSSGWAIQHR